MNQYIEHIIPLNNSKVSIPRILGLYVAKFRRRP